MKTVCGKEISCVVLRRPPYQHVWLSGKIDYLRRPSHNWLQIHEIRGMVSFFNIRLGSSRNKKGDNRLFRKSIETFVHLSMSETTMKLWKWVRRRWEPDEVGVESIFSETEYLTDSGLTLFTQILHLAH